jgi:ketol-acid reductoisomerase
MSSRAILRAASRAATRAATRTTQRRALSALVGAAARRPATATIAPSMVRGVKTINFGGTEEVVHGMFDCV